mmetsp:Transcript_39963/g.127102  ORF Transcript_39963/g.127102 Transcript_39963/m.127102 type:complete len:236 (-) Transcript_39963:179-886(-)
MYVAKDPAWRLGLHHRRLGCEDLASSIADKDHGVQELCAEEPHEEALLCPLRVQGVQRCLRNLLAELPGLVKDQACALAHGVQNHALFLLPGAIPPLNQHLVGHQGEVHLGGVEQGTHQDPPGGNELVVQHRLLRRQGRQLLWRRPRGWHTRRLAGAPPRFLARARGAAGLVGGLAAGALRGFAARAIGGQRVPLVDDAAVHGPYANLPRGRVEKLVLALDVYPTRYLQVVGCQV